MPTYTSHKLGKDSKIYIGTAGATATTQLYHTRDISIDMPISEVDMSDRDDNWDDTDVASTGLQFSIGLLKKSGNKAARATILAAITARTPLAMKITDSDTGNTWDADFVLSLGEAMPYKDAQTMSITAKRTGQSGRGVTVTVES